MDASQLAVPTNCLIERMDAFIGDGAIKLRGVDGFYEWVATIRSQLAEQMNK
jgi:hypothetical protein